MGVSMEMDEVLISKRNTLVIKGGGILLMLVHHLFYSPWSQLRYDDITIHGIGVVNQIGIFSKLCVALFVFISGYGLAASTPPEFSLKDFYFHRFKKLYLNYWYIWLLFVPISVFVFGRTFQIAYGEHAWLKAFLDFLGILKIFDIDGYNPTWWFYSLITILYLLFPLLNKYLYKTPYLIISIAVCLGLLFFPIIKIISGYLLCFITGILLHIMPLSWVSKTRVWQIILAIVLLSGYRFSITCPRHIVEPLLCIGVALLLYKISLWKWLRNVFEELGKHSMNMFLTHTFIFAYWFPRYIYFTREPLLIFFSLLLSSYLFSIMIEWTKKIFGFYKILN